MESGKWKGKIGGDFSDKINKINRILGEQLREIEVDQLDLGRLLSNSGIFWDMTSHTMASST